MKAIKQLCAVLVAMLLFASCAMPVMADGDSGAAGAPSEPAITQRTEASPQQEKPSAPTEAAPKEEPQETIVSSDVQSAPVAELGEQAASEADDDEAHQGEHPEKAPEGELPEEIPGDEQPEETPADEQPEEIPADEQPGETPAGEQPEETPADEQPDVIPEDESSASEAAPQADPLDGLTIRITHDATGEMQYGDTVTLFGHLDGFENVESYTLTWLHDDGDDNWTVAQQGGLSHAFELTEESVLWNWQLTAKILAA